MIKYSIEKILILVLFVFFNINNLYSLTYNQIIEESSKIGVESGKLYVFFSIAKSIGLSHEAGIELLQKWYNAKDNPNYQTYFESNDLVNGYLKFVKETQKQDANVKKNICETIFTNKCPDFYIFLEAPIVKITNSTIAQYKSYGLDSSSLTELILKKASETATKDLQEDFNSLTSEAKEISNNANKDTSNNQAEASMDSTDSTNDNALNEQKDASNADNATSEVTTNSTN